MKQVLVAPKDPEGVGLAANQISLPYNIFVTRDQAFINPEIIAHSDELQPFQSTSKVEKNLKKPILEGCLSLPNYYGMVKRWKWVQVKYLNEQLSMCNDKFEDFPAIVIQHEMDHLNGKIFVERILEQNGKLYKINKNKNRESWEEIEI